MNASYMSDSLLLNLLTNYLITLFWFEDLSGGDFSVGDKYWRQAMLMTQRISETNGDVIADFS